jgi:Fic family protein
MAVSPAGNEWLKTHYHLSGYSFRHSSFIGNNYSIELTAKGNIEEIYGFKYAPSEDTALEHIAFSLKYDDLNLDFLKTVFQNIHKTEIINFIKKSPSGKYARKIGFLFEFLTGNQLDLMKQITGNYTDLLDQEKYITGKATKNTRWRINNNLLGTNDYCPIVRRTNQINSLLNENIKQKIEALKNSYPTEVFRRAIHFLYTKETRSSYEIEKEKPSPDRIERFISLLTKAGKEPTEKTLEKERLIQLQNAIIDSRFAATDFRDFQNYVGESLPNLQNIIHYICPPPQILVPLMEGIKELAIKTTGISPEIRAAIIAFGFVFIHPFEDGNGRLHRFLIHDILVQDNLVPDGLIIPVSAHMLNNIKDYNQILESYSKPLMQKIKYSTDEKGEITILNVDEVAGYYKYPDLTEQCIYLMQTIQDTLKEDMPDELLFIQRYDEARKELQNIVDMPDRDINMMLVFLHQNGGIFPKRRREHFSKLTDEEIASMQRAYRLIYDL